MYPYLLQADGQFIGKTSLGTAVEGQEILLFLRWDKPRQRFVASSQAVGSAPVLSFIIFVAWRVPIAIFSGFAMAESLVLN